MQIWEAANPIGVIILVHGAGEHHRRYEWLGKKWNEQGLTVITGDLPGQGTTRGKKGHIQRFSQYIETVVGWYQHAVEMKLPIFLLGHSMGGLIVIRTLTEKKLQLVEGVILSSPCLGLAIPPSFATHIVTKALHRVIPSLSASAGLRPELNTRNEEIREAYRTDELRVRKVSIRWYQELVKAMKQAHMKVSSFPDIPLMLMQAGEDKITLKEEARRWFNQLEIREKIYKEWNGLYHEIFNEPERRDVFAYANLFVAQKIQAFQKGGMK